MPAPPWLPMCSTTSVAPISAARWSVHPSRVRDFARVSSLLDARLIRYAAWMTMGDRPESARAARQTSVSRAFVAGGAHVRGLLTKIWIVSQPRPRDLQRFLRATV
jgi:hypothetical protein